MKARVVALAALAAAVTLTPVAAAGPHAAKQRVAIDMKLYPQGTFVLTPLQTGPLKRDPGTISHNFLSILGRDVLRDGQKVTIYDGGVATLTGKRGTLTIRDRNEWVHLERDGNGDGELDAIAIGTWKVVRGPPASTSRPRSAGSPRVRDGLLRGPPAPLRRALDPGGG